MKGKNEQSVLRSIDGSRHLLERELVGSLLTDFDEAGDLKRTRIMNRLARKGRLKLANPKNG